MHKIRKKIWVQFSIKLEKPNSGPILAQKPQNKILPQNIIYDQFKTFCYCNFMQKIRKIPRLDFAWNLKSLILDLLAEKPKNKTFL